MTATGSGSPPRTSDRTNRPSSDKLFRVLRYRAVVRHLHLVDCAYACLTHVGLEAQRAQGHHKNKTVLRLPPVQQFKADLRRAVWNEAVKDVAKVSHERTVIRRLKKLLVA